MTLKDKLSNYIQTMSILVLGLFLIGFPIIVMPWTTDFFLLPKQIYLIIAVAVLFLLQLFRFFLNRSLRINRASHNLAFIFLVLIILLSAILSENQYDSLLASVPVLFLGLFYFISLSFVKTKHELLYFVYSFITGGVCALFIGLTPIPRFHNLPFGSSIEQSLYFGLLSLVCLFLIYTQYKNRPMRYKQMITYGVLSLIFVTGLSLTMLKLIYTDKPLILSHPIAIQTALRTLSKNEEQTLKSFLLGSGFGTFETDYARFRPASVNNDNKLWQVIFPNSSSFVLELLTTTGIIGFVAYLYLIYKIITAENNFGESIKNPFFFSLIILFSLSFVIPFTFISCSLLFFILSLFTIYQNITEYDKEQRNITIAPSIPSIGLGIVIVVIIIALAFFSIQYLFSNILLKQSLIAASQNNAAKTYELQQASITLFPYKDISYRVFSQTSLTLAQALVEKQNKHSTPSAQTQKLIYKLIQQSIQAGKTATVISPATSINWQNLSSIYRGLIGFGQNAQQFTINAQEKAIDLNPANPQLRINLGGIYYQLGRFEEARQEFEIAIRLKPDLSNAYYNLGHVYESQGEIKKALEKYFIVKTLVAKDPVNLDKITKEIQNAQTKLGQEPRKKYSSP